MTQGEAVKTVAFLKSIGRSMVTGRKMSRLDNDWIVECYNPSTQRWEHHTKLKEQEDGN